MLSVRIMSPRLPLYLIAAAVLLLAACQRQPTPATNNQPAMDPQLAAMLQEGRAAAARDHLTGSMTDAEILQSIGYDPATFASNRTYGVDGYSVGYTNQTTDIIITRSVSTGISILRLSPKDEKEHWHLDNP